MLLTLNGLSSVEFEIIKVNIHVFRCSRAHLRFLVYYWLSSVALSSLNRRFAKITMIDVTQITTFSSIILNLEIIFAYYSSSTFSLGPKMTEGTCTVEVHISWSKNVS